MGPHIQVQYQLQLIHAGLPGGLEGLATNDRVVMLLGHSVGGLVWKQWIILLADGVRRKGLFSGDNS